MSAPKYAKSVDVNQEPIVKALRDIPGCQVEVIHWPTDILVGYRAHNVLIEIKVPGRESRKDQKKQADWRRDWPGQVQVVTNIDQAVHCVLNCYISEW